MTRYLSRTMADTGYGRGGSLLGTATGPLRSRRELFAEFMKLIVVSSDVTLPCAVRSRLIELTVSDEDEPCAIRVDLGSVEGLTLAKNGRNTQVQIRMSVYDSNFRHFCGRSWMSPFVDTKDAAKLSYNQSVYMHTSINDPGVLIIFEIVVRSDGDDDENIGREMGCGWGFLKLFKQDGKSVDLSDVASSPAKRVDIYQGSPRALLCLEGSVEGNQRLMKLPNAYLLCSVQSHKQLLKISHLFPENCLIGQYDTIPGVVTGGQKSGDFLQHPKLARSVPCSVERVVIRLASSIESFEENLCTMVLNEYNVQQQFTAANSAQVVKRYLTIGVHNGWKYVATPEEVQLSLSSDTKCMNRSGSLRRGHQRSSSTGSVKLSCATSLVHKGRVEIEGLLHDPIFHVVFNLVYDIGLSPVVPCESSARMTHVGQTIMSFTIRWAAVSPFTSDVNSHTLTLNTGTAVNPDFTLVFAGGEATAEGRTTPRKSKLSDTVNFSLNLGSKETGGWESPSDQALDGKLSRSRMSVDSEDSTMITDVHRSRSRTAARGTHVASAAGEAYALAQMIGSKPPLPKEFSRQHQQRYTHPVDAQMVVYPGTDSVLEMASTSPPPLVANDVQNISLPTSHTPILVTVPGHHRTPGLSRTAYAHLHSAGFTPILDRNGVAAEVVETCDAVHVDLNLEDRDRLKANEIVLQFMAFSRVPSTEHTQKPPQTIFFSFQFYNFGHVTSERLLLSAFKQDLSSDSNSLPFILQRFDRDGSVLKGPPGYQVRYQADPAHMQPGEGRLFIRYLAEQNLHIDVWDGDSLLLIGSCIIELKHLCRQGRDAVQVTQYVDIFNMDSLDQIAASSSLVAGDRTRDGSLHPVTAKASITGRLHLRLGNIGQMSDLKMSQLRTFIQQEAKKCVITQESMTMPRDTMGKTRVCKAQHLTDIHQELALLIRSRRQTATSGDEENCGERQLPAEKAKKLARMEKLRQTEKIADTAPLVTIHREKEQRSRDLQTIEMYRTHNKREGILNMLNKTITTEHVIFASMGTAEFFEFELYNPYNVEHVVQIDWQDRDLSVVTDAREWRYLKLLNNVTTPVEEHLFDKCNGEIPQVFLRPKERINVPFKFLTFLADHSVEDQAPSDPFRPFNQTVSFGAQRTKGSEHNSTRHIKVVFRTAEMKNISLLSLRVEMRPHIVNQTFRLSHPEHSFLDRPIRLPPLNTLMEVSGNMAPVTQLVVHCTDPNVMCATAKVAPGEPHDVYVKVACGAAPHIKRFYVVTYVDPFLSRPLQIWQFYVQAMQKIDIAAVLCQTTRVTLVLRGTNSSRLVKCFSSHPDELAVDPRDPFVLPPQAVHELFVAVRPLSGTSRTMHINVVDIELHQLVRSWLVNVIVKPPNVTRTFDLLIGVGQSVNKKITYTNPYSSQRKFDVMCSRPDLLLIKDTRLDMGPNETAKIGMTLFALQASGMVEILVFINDMEGRTEECFGIRAIYK